MRETDFLRAVLDEADCGFLLDLNNLYLNARNHGLDAQALLAELPLERVRQIHLAGFSQQDDILLDTHNTHVSSEVWELYRATLTETGPVPTLIEWDQGIPSLDTVLDEADRARAVQLEMTRDVHVSTCPTQAC